MTGQQLKNSILQMAVQGKLVPQDPNDEPASVLLERIRAEKERLIKEKRIKKEKNPSVIFRSTDNSPYTFLEKIGDEVRDISDEVPFEIPESWEWCRLNDVVMKEIKRGKSPSYANTGSVLVFAQKCNVKTGGINLSLAKYLDDAVIGKYPQEEYMQDRDIIINSTGTGTLGRIGIYSDEDNTSNFPLVPDSHVTIVRADKELSRYLYYILKYYQPFLEESGEGSTKQKELKPDKIKELYVPLPPLSEQHRIVAKIEELLPCIENYTEVETKLNTLNTTFPAQLKKSILQQAVQGKLVPQNPDDEPASVLLERIRAEKQKLIKAGKIKKDKNESVIVTRDKIPYEIIDGKESCIADEVPFEIPEGWAWCRLIDIIEEKPSNGLSPKGVDYVTEVRNLTLTATTSGKFRAEAFKYVDISLEEAENYWLVKGDILIQRSNSRELVGTSCIYDGEEKSYMYPDLMMRIHTFAEINTEYIDYVLKSPFIRKYYSQSASGTSASMPKINQQTVSLSLIPLPPKNEQELIVSRIKELLMYYEML